MLKDIIRWASAQHIVQQARILVNRILVLTLSALLMASMAKAQDEPPLDLRILVDVSSSMQENDPNNLRVPAVHLLIELLPSGSQAGLWTFGRDVNMLVPYGTVDEEWRANARQRVADIGSPGFNSNIGGAMETAAFDFDWSTGMAPKEYILLSDGMVDVPPDEAASRQERSRILNELVPRFRDHNATIHTVLLSTEEDQSDPLFMQQLAAQTGGNDSVAVNPQALLGLFLDILDIAVGDREEVSLDEQQSFLIDSSISEFTATVLHDGSTELTLIDPDGNRYTVDTPPARSDWVSRDDYDLITIRQPDAGSWQIEGDLSPSSRIAVISDLNLQVDTVPLNASVGATIPLNAVMNDVDGQITDADFLQLIQVSAQVREEGTLRHTEDMPLDGAEYSAQLQLPDEPGTYQVVVEADGQTFQRRRVHTVNVREPLSLEVSPGDNAYELSMYPNLPELNDDIRRLLAEIESPDGDFSYQQFEQQDSGRWALNLEPRAGDGTYTVNVDVQLEPGAQRLGDIAVEPIELTFPTEGGRPQPVVTRSQAEPEPEPETTLDELPPVAPIVPPVPEPEPEPEPIPEPAEPETPEPDLDAPAETDQNWLPYLIAAGGGLLVVLVFYAIFRRFTSNDMDMDLDTSLSDAERAVLNDLEGKSSATDVLDETAEKEFASRAAEASTEDIPTVDQPPEEGDEPSILDDDFDLESLGIDSDDDPQVERETTDFSEQEPEQVPDADSDSQDDPKPEEEKASESDGFADDEFDLSDDEIDDMLDDSLNTDDLKPDPGEDNGNGNDNRR